MKREAYRNGDMVSLDCGCDGCQPATVNGIFCHETGCPESWRDYPAECRDCGCDFLRSERGETICPDCVQASDPDFIPAGIEIFYRTESENRRDGWHDPDGETLGRGWYWQACFPGCLPDSDPIGPFETERDAIDDCKY